MESASVHLDLLFEAKSIRDAFEVLVPVKACTRGRNTGHYVLLADLPKGFPYKPTADDKLEVLISSTQIWESNMSKKSSSQRWEGKILKDIPDYANPYHTPIIVKSRLGSDKKPIKRWPEALDSETTKSSEEAKAYFKNKSKAPVTNVWLKFILHTRIPKHAVESICRFHSKHKNPVDSGFRRVLRGQDTRCNKYVRDVCPNVLDPSKWLQKTFNRTPTPSQANFFALSKRCPNGILIGEGAPGVAKTTSALYATWMHLSANGKRTDVNSGNDEESPHSRNMVLVVSPMNATINDVTEKAFEMRVKSGNRNAMIIRLHSHITEQSIAAGSVKVHTADPTKDL